MRRLYLIAIGLWLAGCASTVRAQPAPTGAPKADVAALQRGYVQYLKDEGYSPSVNGDGNVEFKFEGARYLIVIDPNDRNFFQLALPGFWMTEGEEVRRKALAAAQKATMTTKVVKVLVGKGAAYATFEAFVKEPADFAVLLPRALSGIRLAVKTFGEEMGKR